ncbi:unnamed protein product [Ascophyllum nodosum]
MCDLDLIRRDKVPLIKRFSGGGTVIVDRNTIFASIIVNNADVPECKPYPREIMDWSMGIYGPAFENVVKTKPDTRLGLRENDYVFGNLKFGGNAQAITKGRWLHHTSFLWAFEPENMRYLRMPDKKASSPPIPREHSTGLPAASACWKKRCIADWRWVGSSACALPSWREEKMTKDQRTTARGVAFTTNDPRPCPLRSCVASERGLRGFFLRGVRGLSACVADAMQRVY